MKSSKSASIGAPDKLDDFVNRDDRDTSYGNSFLSFARQEYHHTGELSCLARHHWSCYTTDRSLRVLVKNLDGHCPRENSLKEVLKETLEIMALASAAASSEDALETETSTAAKSDFLSSGDEHVFSNEKTSLPDDDKHLLVDIPSAIGRRIRLRRVPDPDRAPDLADYSMATITGWKWRNTLRVVVM